MTGQIQTLQSNELLHICSSCLTLIYHSVPHLDPETLKLLFALCLTVSFALYRVFLIEVIKVRSSTNSLLHNNSHSDSNPEYNTLL